MAWSRSRVVAVISGSGRAGQYQVPSTRMAPPAVCLDAELVSAVVHDRGVAQRAGRGGGSARGAPGCRRGRSRASRSCGRGRLRRPARGRRCRRGLRRAGSGPGRSRGSGSRARRAGGRAVVAMVASSAQAIFRSGLPLSSSRSRWSPSRTYQPPSGSLAHSPARLDGPRENSGTGVASRPVPPPKAATLVVGEHRDAGLQQGIDQRLEPVPGRSGLTGGHRLGASLELVAGSAAGSSAAARDRPPCRIWPKQ